MKINIILLLLFTYIAGNKAFSQNSVSFKFKEKHFYYDHKDRNITEEAFSDSLATGMFGLVIQEVADTSKISLKKNFPEVEDIQHINIPTSSYTDVTNEKIEIGNNGKPSLITFWSTKCGPCLRELRVLNSIAKEYKDVNLYAITHEDSEIINHFLAKKEEELENINIIIDSKRELETKLKVPYHPTHVVIDQNNHIKGIFPGRNIRKILNMFEAILKE